ncbi:MAG: hypothetical protein AMXMBFR13_30760 [Phycisphaerae bacterium]
MHLQVYHAAAWFGSHPGGGSRDGRIIRPASRGWFQTSAAILIARRVPAGYISGRREGVFRGTGGATWDS